MSNNSKISELVLKWYDQHARNLPWRIPPEKSILGIKPNPYHIWLSEIMLQQTTIKAVKPYYEKFIFRWPTVDALANAAESDVMEAWAGLGYYSRARNLKNCAKLIVKNYCSVFPSNEIKLLELPGIGSYTAAAIQAIAFNKNATVIDGNVDRVITRLHAILTPISKSKAVIKSFATSLTPTNRPGDYAQAIMDIGATICIPKKPKCNICPIKTECTAKKNNIATELPSALPKKIKPIRYGYVFVAFTSTNYILLIRRPNTGLLGGTLAFPCSDWTESKNITFIQPFKANWAILNRPVRHTFSHFHLELTIAMSIIDRPSAKYIKKRLPEFDELTLPTLMRKVFEAVSKVST